MAIKATGQITLSAVVDVNAVYRYYLLQSSTLSKPSKPTTYPPSSSWDDTEPTYTEGSTKSLYTVDCTVFSDNTFKYSEVSLSSSYEAAKVAYNKANNAQNEINTLETNISTNYATKAELQANTNSITSTVQSVETIATTALSQGVEYIVGTQTAATNAWTGVTTSNSLFIGKTIAYKLPYAGTSSSATLNLTLPNGTTTGAKGIRRMTSTVTTQYGAGTVINMTYDGEFWRLADYDSNTYDRIRYNQAVKCGTTAIVAKNIIVGESSGYKHLKAGTAFDLTYPILYADSAISASATGTSNYLAIAFTVTTTQSITLTAYKPVYIKGTLTGKMFTPVSTTPLTQTEPTSVDGYFYILLGTAYSTTGVYLQTEHPLFKYDGTAFKAIEQIVIENQSRIVQTEESIQSVVENYATKTEVDQRANGLEITVSDVQEKADNALLYSSDFETRLAILEGSISQLVQDGNGGTLIKQTSEGLFYFDISEISENMSNTSNGLNELDEQVKALQETVGKIDESTDSLMEKTEYIRSYTDANDNPCIELGEGDSTSMMSITNEAIKLYHEGAVKAEISNNTLKNENVKVKSELQVGDDADTNTSGVWVWKQRSNGNLGLTWKGRND